MIDVEPQALAAIEQLEQLDPHQLLDGVGTRERTLQHILEMMPVPVFVKDLGGTYLTCNHPFAEFLGLRADQIIGFASRDVLPADAARAMTDSDEALLSNPSKTEIQECGLKTLGDEARHVQIHKMPVRSRDGSVIALVGVVFDITEQTELTRRLSVLARNDDLTGLDNRREGMRRVHAMIEQSERASRPCAVLLMDIDHFKKVNDTHGHESGDRVLKQVAATIKDTLRDYDVCYRLGGEEFAAGLPDTSLEIAAVVAERIRAACAAQLVSSIRAGEPPLQVTMSLGVAAYPEHGRVVDELLRKSDAALYEAKGNGRNQVRIASEEEETLAVSTVVTRQATRLGSLYRPTRERQSS
ncbi:MAG: GGDEF domain-containing protein [Chromatiales bacterium]|jgi:diguanylate cyclase (GGDEF)-like protein/PAS domain S-box-containing protein|nr:GGDEF domain-containing protein [Chromatiales bacterium]